MKEEQRKKKVESAYAADVEDSHNINDNPGGAQVCFVCCERRSGHQNKLSLTTDALKGALDAYIANIGIHSSCATEENNIGLTNKDKQSRHFKNNDTGEKATQE